MSYNLHVAVYLAVMYLVYKLALADEKQPVFNRLLIGGIVLAAFAAQPLQHAVQAMMRSDVPAGTVSVDMGSLVGLAQEEAVPVWPMVLVGVYAAGVLAVGVLTAVQYLRMLSLFRHGEEIKRDGYSVILLDDSGVAPFSWGRHVVMQRKDYSEAARHILAHEEAHIRASHSVDMVLMQLVCILQWFNPAAWLLRSELKTVHEYQADASVLRSGANMKEYQMLLIKKAVGTRFPALANSLNHSNLKKRITMMYKSKSEGARRLRALAIAPALALGLGISGLPAVSAAASCIAAASFAHESAAVAVSDSVPAVKIEKAAKLTKGRVAAVRVAKAKDDKGTKNSAKTPEKMPETMPQFPGGEKAMMAYLIENVAYPAQAKAEGREGKTVVQFTVSADGSVRNVQVMKNIGEDLDAEAIRVVSAMPKWEPAMLDGKAVDARYALPIVFKIPKAKTEAPAAPAAKAGPAIMVDGEMYAGELNSIPTANIESMEVVKNKAEFPNGLIMIRLKK